MASLAFRLFKVANGIHLLSKVVASVCGIGRKIELFRTVIPLNAHETLSQGDGGLDRQRFDLSHLKDVDRWASEFQ